LDRATRLEEICNLHLSKEGPLLPILHAVHAEFGCIDEAAMRTIADALNLSRAEVYGVVSFYHDFSPTPDDRPEVQICRAEACQARGVEALMREAQRVAGDRVRLKSVYCLGLCSVGPNARVGEELYARLDAAKLTQLIERA